MYFIEVRSLAGMNFIRAADILAVQYADREKCTVVLTGGVTIACTESASAVAARVTEAMRGDAIPSAPNQNQDQENANGDAGV